MCCLELRCSEVGVLYFHKFEQRFQFSLRLKADDWAGNWQHCGPAHTHWVCQRDRVASKHKEKSELREQQSDELVRLS